MRENKGFKEVLVYLLPWVVLFYAFVLQVTTDQSIGVDRLSFVLLSEQLGFVVIDLE